MGSMPHPSIPPFFPLPRSCWQKTRLGTRYKLEDLKDAQRTFLACILSSLSDKVIQLLWYSSCIRWKTASSALGQISTVRSSSVRCCSVAGGVFWCHPRADWLSAAQHVKLQPFLNQRHICFNAQETQSTVCNVIQGAGKTKPWHKSTVWDKACSTAPLCECWRCMTFCLWQKCTDVHPFYYFIASCCCFELVFLLMRFWMGL